YIDTTHPILRTCLDVHAYEILHLPLVVKQTIYKGLSQILLGLSIKHKTSLLEYPETEVANGIILGELKEKIEMHKRRVKQRVIKGLVDISKHRSCRRNKISVHHPKSCM
ncbi:unnamed protein product, partial [Sphenostylis stenocarpa]